MVVTDVSAQFAVNDPPAHYSETHEERLLVCRELQSELPVSLLVYLPVMAERVPVCPVWLP